MRQDRDLMTIKDPERLLAAMDEVLADIGADIAELPEIRPSDRDRLAGGAPRAARVPARELPRLASLTGQHERGHVAHRHLAVREPRRR